MKDKLTSSTYIWTIESTDIRNNYILQGKLFALLKRTTNSIRVFLKLFINIVF